MRPIRVVLVEDNAAYRESLEFLLDRRDDIQVVGTVAAGSAAARACADLEADVAVIDYRLPDIDGAEAASAVRDRCPTASVVFLSASAGSEERDAARVSGWALVQKGEGIERLAEAIHAAGARDA